MHVGDLEKGMLPAIAIVGGNLPIVMGMGLAFKIRSEPRVAVSFFGDGAVNEGAFHEALNLAGAWNLPAVFVCENNVYGFSTHYRRVTPVEHVADRAASYGMPGRVVDGMDLLAVYDAAEEAVGRARRGEGPSLLECKTYRFMGHSRFEKASYRDSEELERWRKRDPIPSFRSLLAETLGVPEDEIAGVEREVEEELDAAVRFAEESPDPGPKDYRQYIFAPEGI